MNARKTILVLGSIALALVASVIAFALFAHAKIEKDNNRARTAPARAARHAKTNPDQQIEKEADGEESNSEQPEVTE